MIASIWLGIRYDAALISAFRIAFKIRGVAGPDYWRHGRQFNAQIGAKKRPSVSYTSPETIAQHPLNATCGRSPAKNNGRNRTPTPLPMNAATSHTQPCRLPEAMPLKYAPMLQP